MRRDDAGHTALPATGELIEVSELDRARARRALRSLETPRTGEAPVFTLSVREFAALIAAIVAVARRERPAEEPARILTTADVARMVGVRPDTVQKWHRRQGLPAFRVGRRLRFRRREVEAWLERRAAEPRAWTGHRRRQLSKIREEE
ncbi:MAG TPA: helix-turn-helix domain-containing protein [Polyangiaceae bacterium LLY-WYZ-15_(1-7)]|nr:helix-turn-helix domain-containing protein [Polyangiaceae bacterium LLY-WYZ-15_(1-7)]